MKLGISHCNVGPLANPEAAAQFAQRCEAVGVESLWTVDHVAFPVEIQSRYPETPDGELPWPRDTPLADPLIWSAYVAAQTSRVRLGSAVIVAPQRETLLLTKQLASLATLAEDRLILGVGVGWLKEEFAALGADFDGRGQHLDDQIDAMRHVWSGNAQAFRGERFSFEGVHSHPLPPKQRVPIHIGGYSKIAARRASRVGDGYFPGGYVLDDRLAELISIARGHGVQRNDRFEVTVRWSKDPDDLSDRGFVTRAKAIGADRLVVPAQVFAGPDGADLLARAVETSAI